MSVYAVTELADQLGQEYSKLLSDEYKKDFGHYLTPPEIAIAMGQGLSAKYSNQSTVTLLDPAAGAGILTAAFCESLLAQKTKVVDLRVVAYELDTALTATLRSVLAKLQDKFHNTKVKFQFEIRNLDFILDKASVLTPQLFPMDEVFDAVISNPPYFKLPKDDARSVASLPLVHGQPNIYGFFMGICANLLKAPSGHMCFIVPRSFASGPYFLKFREHFFSKVTPQKLHIFKSRKDAFARDAVLQENVILDAVVGAAEATSRISITVSDGLRDLLSPTTFNMPLSDVLVMNSTDKVLCIPSSEEELHTLRRLKAWTHTLSTFGMQISTGPVVPFRATQLLRKEPLAEDFPLLWIQNVLEMNTVWPIETRKEQYLANHTDSEKLLVPNKNYVVLRRFSPKEQLRRLTAAPLYAKHFTSEFLGIENHVNYIHKPKSSLSEEEVAGIAGILSCKLLDVWFRATNGNTQVSATEIRAMPLPELDTIAAIGAEIISQRLDLESIDRLVEHHLLATEDRATKNDRPLEGHKTIRSTTDSERARAA